jgi:L-asparaginase / beta-aspartyl-peptidase
MIKYGHLQLNDACDRLMQEKLTPFGGQAGLVAMDREGNIRFIFNTERMYRASRSSDSEPMVAIYK